MTVRRRALLIGLAFCAAGLLVTLRDRASDTAKDGYLIREGYNGTAYEEELEATYDDHKETVTVRVEPRHYTEDEAKAWLDQAENLLPGLLFGEAADGFGANSPGSDLSEAELPGPIVSEARYDRITVRKDLVLPESIADLPVTAEYYTTRSQVLAYDGRIGPEAEADGTAVNLEVILHCGEISRPLAFPLVVYPADRGELTFQEKVDEAVRAANQGEEETWLLPGEIDGSAVSWRSRGAASGATIGAFGIAAAVLYLYAHKKRQEEAERRKKESMIRDYPHIVSKLVLLLGAGLSMRRAFCVIAEDYRQAGRAAGEKRWGFEAVCEMCADLEAGTPEAEAYQQFGRSCGLPLYRTLSVLLSQNLRKGGRELTAMLEREALSAMEERKKEARILGEKASAKLLLPMMLMLLIVFVIVMVPAFLSL